MTAEILHDALTLLPEDLVAETAAARENRESRVIRWKIWAPALAACLAVAVLGTISIDLWMPRSESALTGEASRNEALYYGDSAAPAEAQESMLDEFTEAGSGTVWQNRDTMVILRPDTSARDRVTEPQAELITSLGAFTDKLTWDETGSLIEKYSREWFHENDLLLIRLPGSGWYPDALRRSGEGWEVYLSPDPACGGVGEEWIFMDLLPGELGAEASITIIYR